MASKLVLNTTQGTAGTYTGSTFNVFNSHELMAMLNVPANASGSTLDVYLQFSCDDGNTWNDFIHFTQVTTAASTQFAGVSGYITGGAAPVAQKDGTLAAGTITQGPFGTMLRAKYVVGAGLTAAYTITLAVDTKG